MISELEDSQIDELLLSEVTGRIGCCVNDEVYVVPISYAFDNGYIICHSIEGKKIEMMRKNPKVCFEVDRMENLVNWRSVIIEGIYEELTGQMANFAMQKLITRFQNLRVSQTMQIGHSTHPSNGNLPRNNAIVFWIRVVKKSGRYEMAK